MKDWRGNEYTPGNPLVETCCKCSLQAVRHFCNAEGNQGRTHHHGQIHALTGGGAKPYCDEHGREILAENDAMRIDRMGA